MRILMLYYGLLIGGLAFMLLPGLGMIAFLVYFIGMPIGAAVLWWTQGRAWRETGLWYTPRAGRYIALGSASALAAVVLVFCQLRSVGWATLADEEWNARHLLFGLVIPQCGVAVVEEFTFRGVIQQIIAARRGFKQGLWAASVMFGIFHIPNILYQDVPLRHIPITLVVLVGMGLLWGWAFGRAKHLALPIALHWGWNVAAYGIQAKLIITPTAPAALVGTATWFPESGAAAFVGLTLLVLPIWVLTRASHVSPGNQ